MRLLSRLGISPPIAGSILSEFLAASNDPDEPDVMERLTPRERQVLQLLAEGGTNRAIARELVISVKTVEKHRTHLMAKLNVHDLAGLVRVAVKHGLASVEQ